MDFGSPTAVREGIALSEEGLSPYAGDIFHEVIMLHTFISQTTPILAHYSLYMHCMFICDVLKVNHFVNKYPAIVYICTASILVSTWSLALSLFTNPPSPYQTPIVLELFKVLYALGEWAVGALFVVS